jgi:predicted DNA-binding protein (MmcQ/YjbR family)
MTLDRFRKLCLAQPGATEQIQWGADAVFKIGGKMFAVACTEFDEHPDAKKCSFKCDDETFAALIERDGVVPAPYLARAKWVALDEWSALDDKEITELVARSHALVAAGLPKKVQAALGMTASAGTGRAPRAPASTTRASRAPASRARSSRTPSRARRAR